MLHKLTRLALTLGLASTAAFAGCAGDELDEDLGTVESSAAELSATTAGVKWLGDFHLKNRSVCAQESGAVLGTTRCSSSTKQLFSVFQMPDGNYRLCKQGTTRTFARTEGGGGYVPPAEVVGYQSQCLVGDGKGSDLRFRKVELTKTWKFAGEGDETARTTVANGVIRYNDDGTLGYIRGRGGNLAVNLNGVVVIGNNTASPNQIWSVY